MNSHLKRVFNVSAMLLALTPAIVSAEIITFTDRAAWEAAVGAVTLVDFNAQVSDHYIDPDHGGSAFDAGPFTITEIGTQSVPTKIEVHTSSVDIDGTPYLRSYLGAGDYQVTVLTYDAPIVAWGADVKPYTGSQVNYDFMGAGFVSDSVFPTPSFFGMLSTDQPFSVIKMTSNITSIIHFDNIVSSDGQVTAVFPELVSWDIDANGELLGARNVEVDGVLYDVQFIPGTCADAFGSCELANFQFQTSNDARQASLALLEQVFVDLRAGQEFDAAPGKTYGCVENGILCEPHTPYTTDGVTFTAQRAMNWLEPYSECDDRYPYPGGCVDTVSSGSDSVDWTTIWSGVDGNSVWARWTPAVTEVMDFNDISCSSGCIGSTYTEDGYQLTTTGQFYHGNSPHGGNSSGVYIFPSAALNVWTMTKVDGGAFDLLAMGVSEINDGVAAQTLMFTGLKTDLTMVTQAYTTNGPGSLPLETTNFVDFTNLLSVSWAQASVVYDNIVMEGLPAVRGDMNGDGNADILWRHNVSGLNYVYLMNGTSIQVSTPINAVSDMNWKVVGNGDMDGDGKADILWRNIATGENYMYLMNGVTIQSGAGINVVADQNWEVVGNGDMNGDGKADILWRNRATGENYGWLMNGATIQSGAGINVIADQNWKIVGTGDMNGDGKADILWRHMATGENYVYLMNGASIQTSVPVNTVSDLNWKIVGNGDMDGDGKADILWRNSVSGLNYLYLMNGPTIQSGSGINVVSDLNWEVVGNNDMNGDGKADILWRNMATGENYVYLMNGAAILSRASINTIADLNWQICNTR